MRAKVALVLLCSLACFLTACGGEGSTTLPSAGGGGGGGTGTLQFVTTSLPAALENTPYSALITAGGSAGGSYSWTVGTGTPPGVFNTSSTTPGQLAISGLFTPAGSYTFDVTVGDFAGQSVTRSFTIAVNASGNLALVPDVNTAIFENQDHTFRVYAQGGTQPFTFSLLAGNLPSGMSFTPLGAYVEISGAPSQSGAFNFSVRCDDAAGRNATCPLQWYVNPARTWTALSGAPVDQQGSVCIDLFNTLWVWGGRSGATPGQGNPINTGYTWPLSGAPTATPTSGAPAARFGHSAVHTGSAMIVWGGRDSSGAFGDGGKLGGFPAAWSAISSINAPSPRFEHSAVWTGTEMIVWGGRDTQGNALTNGGAYNPATNAWRTLSTAFAPQARFGHRVEFVSGRMVVFGGTYSSMGINVQELFDGGVYDPAADQWEPFGSYGSGSGATATMVCTGNGHALFWGMSGTSEGIDLILPPYQAFGYMATFGAPAFRTGHSAVWTGTEMLIFGGQAGALLNDGGAYRLATNSWTTLATGAPQARKNHKAFWLGHQMLVFGGEGLDYAGQPVMLGAAALYTP